MRVKERTAACHPELHSSLQASRSHKQHTSLLNPWEGLQTHSSHQATATQAPRFGIFPELATQLIPLSQPLHLSAPSTSKWKSRLVNSCLIATGELTRAYHCLEYIFIYIYIFPKVYFIKALMLKLGYITLFIGLSYKSKSKIKR